MHNVAFIIFFTCNVTWLGKVMTDEVEECQGKVTKPTAYDKDDLADDQQNMWLNEDWCWLFKLPRDWSVKKCLQNARAVCVTQTKHEISQTRKENYVITYLLFLPLLQVVWCDISGIHSWANQDIVARTKHSFPHYYKLRPAVTLDILQEPFIFTV